MKAAWYERQGPAAEVLTIGEQPTPVPGRGEVRIKVAASGVNPGDVKKRQDTFGVGMPFPRVIPHSDGAGVIEAAGDQVPAARIGEKVWCFGAQSYRPFGTAAEYVVVPAEQAIPLPAGVSFAQGACLGIPGLTAHRAVHVAGEVRGRIVLVQGGAGAVGQCAVGLARHAGATVIASVRSAGDVATAQRAGAHHVLVTGDLSPDQAVDLVRLHAPEGIDHVVEVAFQSNIFMDERLLRLGGSIAAYATDGPTPTIPFWPLVFKNVRIFFLGSDDFEASAKAAAASALNEALLGEWPGFAIGPPLPLEAIARAHEAVETHSVSGRMVIGIGPDIPA